MENGIRINKEREGLLYIFALSTISMYSIILLGARGKSKYSRIGAIRGIGQLVSYEIFIGINILGIIIMNKTYDL
jgi:NADH-quinone oxidoreductase subunit H